MGEKDPEKNDGKKDSGAAAVVTVVLKVDLHCEGCAQKLKKSLRKLHGVESVKVDYTSNKVTVVGKVDPAIVKEKVEEKMKKKVDLISPQPPKKDKNTASGDGGKKADDKSEKSPDDSKKADEKKPKEPQVTTVVLKTKVHCDGCAHKMKKIIKKCEGVQEVNVDLSKDQITLKGTMDMKKTLPYLNSKMKGAVELAKKDEGGGKKSKEGGGEESKAKEGAKSETSKVESVNKVELYNYPYGVGFQTFEPRQMPGGGFVGEYWHGPPQAYMQAPQMFSDENPNACVVM